MNKPATQHYGTTRCRRPTVSYAEFERAADELLGAGGKPGLDNVRKAIGGSPETIRQMLRRYWADLAALKRTPANALKRLPSDVADLADELWQRALALAEETATKDDNAARERLEQLKRDNEVRSHGLILKDKLLREREEARERTLSELQEQVATLLAIVSRNTETISALQASKAGAEAQTEDYRQRLARLVARAVVRNQAASNAKSLRIPARGAGGGKKSSSTRPNRARRVPRAKPHAKLPRAPRRKLRR